MTAGESRSILHIYSRPFAVLLVVAAVALPLLIGLTMAGRRGWPIGVVCSLIFAGAMIGGFLPSYQSWARRHPVIDGAALGPITLVFVLPLTPLRVWACLVIALASTGLGALSGARRRRRRERGDGGSE